MEKDVPIGILDSGIGGIGILKEIATLLPFEDIVYFADSNRAPYGDKTEGEIEEIVLSIVSYLKSRYNIKLCVLACNTATVSAVSFLRSTLSSLPIVGVVPMIKPASISSKTKEVICLATDRTVKSKAQGDLISEFALLNGVKVHNIPCHGIVELIEEGLGDSIELSFKLAEYIKPLSKYNADTVILGCTHYTLIEEQIKALFPSNVSIINSNEAIARQVKRVLGSNNRLFARSTSYHFVVNGDIEHFAKLVQPFLGLDFSVSSYEQTN